MIRLKSLLQEYIVKDLTTGKEHSVVVVWKDKLFILDTDSDISELKAHLRQHPYIQKSKYSKESLESAESVYDIVSLSGELPPDVVTGDLDKKNKRLFVHGIDKSNPSTSIIIRKIVKDLGIKQVSKSDDEDSETINLAKKKITGEVPSVGFHGTSTEFLDGILKKGLRPAQTGGNFGDRGVEHYNEIFFAARFDQSKFYSSQAVHNHGGGQVILQISIPDKSLIAPDYDAEITSKHQKYYDHPSDRSEDDTSEMKPLSLSKELGKFGYSGTILPNHIQWVYIYQQMNEKWVKYRPSTVRKNLDKYGDEWYMMIGAIEY